MPSSRSSSPEIRRKHKHRSSSYSPRDKERRKRKKAKYDSDDTNYDTRTKRHRHKHRSRDHGSGTDDGGRHKHRDRDGESRRQARVKEEPEDCPPSGSRRIKREPASRWETDVKREPSSDEDEHHRWRDQERERQANDRRRRDRRRDRDRRVQEGELDEHEFGQQGGEAQASAEPVEKEKPNFELSGKLTEETNTYRGVVIKYSEPPEARKPKRRWRLYPFKDGQSLPVLHIHRQSAYLMGRDRKVVDIPIDHPSCSKQHSALQFRLVPYQRDDGRTGHAVRPYIIDLGSTNGTHVNNKRIEPQRYVQLLEKDVLKFGFSSREYVLLHDASKGSDAEDDGESN